MTTRTITLEIPVELAKLVTAVVNRAADDGEATFAAAPDQYSVTANEAATMVIDLRRFTALVTAALTDKSTERILIIEPARDSMGVAWYLKSADAVSGWDFGDVSPTIAGAFYAALRGANRRGRQIIEVRSDCGTVEMEAKIYRVPFKPLTPDE